MNHNNLSNLSDEELVRHADNIRDPLLTSDLEIELINRFTLQADWAPVHAVLEDLGFDQDNHEALRSDLELAAAVKSLFEEFDLKDSDDLHVALQALADAREALLQPA